MISGVPNGPSDAAFGVPATLPAARRRLPSGSTTVSLAAVSFSGATLGADVSASPRVPAVGELVGCDWVVADCVLWTWPSEALADLSAALQAVGDNADNDGVKLAFVEPTAGLGLRDGLQRLAGPLLARRTGHRHHRDIPHELRQVGFVVTTTVRFTNGLGHYVWGEARHYRHPITIR